MSAAEKREREREKAARKVATCCQSSVRTCQRRCACQTVAHSPPLLKLTRAHARIHAYVDARTAQRRLLSRSGTSCAYANLHIHTHMFQCMHVCKCMPHMYEHIYEMPD